MNFISLQLRASTSATEAGIRGFGDLRLADPSESLAEQCLDGLDPSPVIRNGDLLPKTLPALRTTAGRPRLSRRVGRSLEQDAANGFDFLGGRERECGADRRWTS